MPHNVLFTVSAAGKFKLGKQSIAKKWYTMRIITVLFLALNLKPTISVEPRVGSAQGVYVDPTLSAEVASLKTTLASVQGSLITSVGLIQDQLDQFGKQYLSSVETRLSAMELKMASFEDTVKRLNERAAGWETMQHHVRSWGDQMTSLDTKVDHLGRTQVDRITTLTGQVNSLQSGLTLSIEAIGEQMTAMEGRLQRSISDPNPQIMSSLQRLEAKNKATTSHRLRSSHSNRTGICVDLRREVRLMSLKLDSIGAKHSGSHQNEDAPLDISVVHGYDESDIQEQQLVKIIRKVALPFKKANKRLRDMEDIGHQLETTMGEIRSHVRLASNDLDRKFNDFFNMTLEMFEHQHHQMEMSEQTLAGLKQCCRGTTSDLSNFRAKAEPILSKVEAFVLASEREGSSARSRSQLRFESDRILSVLKQQENLLIDGFDKCLIHEGRSSPRPPAPSQPPEWVLKTTTTTTTTTSTSTTTTTTSVLTSEIEDESIEDSETVIDAGLTEGAPEALGNAEKMLQTCEQLLEAGFLESKVYTVEVAEAGGDPSNPRDFRQRYCDQITSGGGWTVTASATTLSRISALGALSVITIVQLSLL